MLHCVYLTVYKGKRLPKRYVGSTTVPKIKEGYRGTVSSKKWKTIFLEELQNNPHLFKTRILSYHNTKEERAKEELRLQIKYDVVKSPLYMNESLAQPNGFCGRSLSGEDNPMYGKGYLIKKARQEGKYDYAPQKLSKTATKQWQTMRDEMIAAMKGKKKSRKKLTEEEFRQLQAEKSAKSKEKNCKKYYHNGIRCVGLNELKRATGISVYYLRKMIKSGEIKEID